MKKPTNNIILSLTIIFLTLFPAIWVNTIAQSQVRGRILNGSGEPLPYANVLLLSSEDSVLVLGAVSEENGDFQFSQVAQESYLLSVSMVGYDKYYEVLEINSNREINLPNIRLLESSEDLEEVIVAAKKPLYERQIDRMVINVQESITSAGNSVLEVLQKSPGVTVNRQGNSFMLNGKGGVVVMINNKLTRLPMEAVFQLIEGMSAANVEKIELITNPPAKYEAEGTGGIIHIITQEHEDIGTNGNWGLTAGRNARENLGANFNVNHRKSKASLFLDFSILYDRNIEAVRNGVQIIRPDFISRLSSTSERYSTTATPNLRTGGEFQVSKKTAIGAMVTFAHRNFNMDATTNINNEVTRDSTVLATTAIQETNSWKHFTGNVNLTHSFNDRSELRLDLDYLKSHNHNPSSYLNRFYFPEIDQNSNQRIDVRKETPLDIKIGSMEYIFRAMDNFTLEAGVKGSHSSFINDVAVTYTENGAQRIDPALTDIGDLDETIYAAYLSADWTINETNQVKAGLRYEHTKTFISTLEEFGAVDRNFGNFFPTFYYKKTFSDHIVINLGYSRRISRPTFWELAPFVYIVDPNTFFSGNPALRPSILDGYKLDLKIKRAILTFDYSNSKNEIVQFQPEVDLVSARQIIRSQNLDFQRIYGITLSLPWIFTDWWDIQVNGGGFYREIKTSHLEENEIRTFYNFNLNFVNTIQLPKDFAFEISGFYEPNAIMGLMEFRPFGALNLGVQKKLPNNGGTLRFSVDDIFYTNLWRIRSHIPEANFYSRMVWDWHAQTFRVNYTRSFGNKKLKEVKIKSGSEEERKRVQQ